MGSMEDIGAALMSPSDSKLDEHYLIAPVTQRHHSSSKKMVLCNLPYKIQEQIAA